LRLSEGIKLSPADIDADRMQIHIRDSKGNKDRLVPLPVKTLHALRKFWCIHRNPSFLFPNSKRGLTSIHLIDSPLDRNGIQAAMKIVIGQIGIKKKLVATHCVTVMQPICLKPG